MLDQLPEVIIIGDIEMLFIGMAIAVGAPEATRKALKRRYKNKDTDDESS